MNISSIGKNLAALSQEAVAAVGIMVPGAVATIVAVAGWRWAHRPITIKPKGQQRALRQTPPTRQVTSPSAARERSSVPIRPPLTTPIPQTQTESTRGESTGNSQPTTTTSTPDANAALNQTNNETKATPVVTTTSNGESGSSTSPPSSSSMQTGQTSPIASNEVGSTTSSVTQEPPAPAPQKVGGATAKRFVSSAERNRRLFTASPYFIQGDQYRRKKDWQVAKDFYEQGQKNGDVGCIYRLAQMHRGGHFFKKDPDKALELLKPLINRRPSLPLAIELYGRIWHRDKNNPEKARVFFAQAAALDYEDAQYTLASMFRDGIGGDQDLRMAREWYDKASKHRRSPSAHLRLAEMLIKGEGGPQNFAEAKKRCEEAKKQSKATLVHRKADELLAIIAEQQGQGAPLREEVR